MHRRPGIVVGKLRVVMQMLKHVGLFDDVGKPVEERNLVFAVVAGQIELPAIGSVDKQQAARRQDAETLRQHMGW